MFRVCCFLCLLSIVILSSCSDPKQDALVDISRRINVISDIYQSDNIIRAKNLSMTLAQDYPDNPMTHQAFGAMLLEHSKSLDYGKEKEKTIAEGFFEIKKSLAMLEEIKDYEEMLKRKMGLAYAYYDQMPEDFYSDPSFRYAVIDYADALAKKGRHDEAIFKYAYIFKFHADDPRLIQGYIKLQSDNDYLGDSVFIADGFMKKHGFDSGVMFEKCNSYYTHNLQDKSFECLVTMRSKITDSDAYYPKMMELLNMTKEVEK